MKALVLLAIALAALAACAAPAPPPPASTTAPCGLTPEEQAAPIAPSANYVAPAPSAAMSSAPP